MEVYEKQFFSSFAEVDEVVKDALDKLMALEIKNFDKVEFRINFMLREVLNNAVEHGNQFDRTKRVHIKINYEDHYLYFAIQDEGSGVEVARHGINDFVLRERNRGYEVIKNFQFDVEVEGNIVKVSLNMKRIQ